MASNSQARGFTLIEVVVALAIVAIGLFAVFRVIGDTTQNVTYLRDKSFAGWIADNRLTDMRLSGQMPSVDETEGEIEFAGRRWHWTANVSQTPVEGLRRIDVRVRREDDAAGTSLAQLAAFVGATAMMTGPSPTPWNSGEHDPGDDDGDET